MVRSHDRTGNTSHEGEHMKMGINRRGIAAVAAAALGFLSSRGADAAVVAGPESDLKAASTGVSVTISIHSQFWKVTDDITIIWNSLSANAAGVGYAETTADPNVYRLTTIYGNDLNPAGPLVAGSVAGVTPASDFTILGGEHIHGVNGVTYDSSVNEFLPYAQLVATYPQFDMTPFNPAANPTGSFFTFTTFVPAAAVPEPTAMLSVLGGVAMFSLRRRRST